MSRGWGIVPTAEELAANEQEQQGHPTRQPPRQGGGIRLVCCPVDLLQAVTVTMQLSLQRWWPCAMMRVGRVGRVALVRTRLPTLV